MYRNLVKLAFRSCVLKELSKVPKAWKLHDYMCVFLTSLILTWFSSLSCGSRNTVHSRLTLVSMRSRRALHSTVTWRTIFTYSSFLWHKLTLNLQAKSVLLTENPKILLSVFTIISIGHGCFFPSLETPNFSKI